MSRQDPASGTGEQGKSIAPLAGHGTRVLLDRRRGPPRHARATIAPAPGRSRRPPNREGPIGLRILSLAAQCYFDEDGGAAAHRIFVEGLARFGFGVEVLGGTTLASGRGGDPAARLAARDRPAQGTALEFPPGSHPPDWPYPPSCLRLDSGGVPVHLLCGPTTDSHEPDDAEASAFLFLLDHLIGRARPDALVAHGADRLAAEALRRGRSLGIPTALRLRHRGPHDPHALAAADAVLVPSRALADEIHEATGRPCTALPDPVDPDRVRAESGDRKYLLFVDPTPAQGLAAFARIADELGRRRPDIPLLVVSGPEGREALDHCGLDLRRHGTIDLMRPPADPRVAWGRARLALAPALDASGPPPSAISAILNGLPVVASDRDGLPEVLGHSGVVLPLPGRITAATGLLPTAEEVAPWVEAVVRLWDDAGHHDEHRRRAALEARRWDPGVLGPHYLEFFRDLRSGPGPTTPPPRRSGAVVLVPHLEAVEPECEDGLKGLERAGVRVLRRRGSSQIDVARNEMASDALHDGFEAILFVDADLGFDPLDALRLLARPEPVISGLYAKKGPREMASVFADGIGEVLLGPDAPGPYPLKYAAAGFLRIRAAVLRRMVEELGLPLCNRKWGRGCWPFFQPAVVPHPEGGHHYLGEDWAFSHRLAMIGVTPLADTSFRLWHHGRYGYSWEDAGAGRPRHRAYRFRP